jgi:hypothetical protein
MKYLRLAVCLVLVATPSLAQPTNLYEDDLTQLSGELRGVMVRVSQMSPPQRRGAYNIRKELLTISKKLHRIEEEAMSADLELGKQGQNPNRDLAYAAAVSEQLDTAGTMVSHYLDVGDVSFWTAAQASAKSARELTAAR